MNRRAFLHGLASLGGLAFVGAKCRDGAVVEEVRRRGAEYLAARQSPDGAWRSADYGAFRGGDALTPLVLWALQGQGESRALDAGWQWLEALTDSRVEMREPWADLAYPLFTAGYAARCFGARGDRDRAAVWVRLVLGLRTSPALGWSVAEAACGAWGDSATPPRRASGPLADMVAPNISATVLAVQALAAAGLAAEAASARPFLQACQNYAKGEGTACDDGGFFFAPDDPVRNKAGVSAREPGGRERYRSYGAATCDGLLALRVCGAREDEPRISAASGWLWSRARGLEHSGEWPASRASARESLVFYHAQGLAEVLATMPGGSWTHRESRVLAEDLTFRQSRDGSWRGNAPASCEDDPLVATAFALRALGLATK